MNSPQGAWDNIAEQMLLEFAEIGHPIFRATTPLSRGALKSKGRGKLSMHFAADQDTIDTIYRIIPPVNQLSVYGAVAAICEEFESHQDGTGQPVEGRLHKVQEDCYLKNRDDADEFNLAMDDENIDFNISSIPDATVKRSQSISVHDLIQKIESRPQKEAIQNDLEQHSIIQSLQRRVKSCDYGCREH